VTKQLLNWLGHAGVALLLALPFALCGVPEFGLLFAIAVLYGRECEQIQAKYHPDLKKELIAYIPGILPEWRKVDRIVDILAGFSASVYFFI